MERFSYREHQAQFSAACDWLSSLGVSVAATRAAEYARLLGKIADHHEAGTIDVLLNEYGRAPIFNAMTEALEFVHIHTGLASRAEDAMIKNLREFVTGAVMLTDETPKNSRSRNLGFELSVGAAAARCGLPVHFEPPADLSITVERHSLAVECKRPFTVAKVENNVRKGLNQLRQRYEAGQNPATARGILAISVTRTENDGSKALDGETEAIVRAKIDGILDRFVAKHQRRWQSRVDSRTLAVLLELSAPCFVHHPSIFAVARHYTWVVLCPRGSEDRATLDRVALGFNRFKTSL